MKQVFIYKIENVENGKRYIGSSVTPSKRWYQHKQQLRKGNHHSTYLQNSWNKYGEECFVFEVIDECFLENQFLLEKEWIIKENTVNPEYGYNMALPTEVGGHEKTEEVKKKLSVITKKNMLAYHEKQRSNGRYTIRVYDLVTGEYEIFPSTKDCPYSFKKNGNYNFRIGKCKLDNNLTELELQEKYNQFKIRYENALISQSSQTAYIPVKKDIYSHQYSTIWRSDDETLYFKTNKEAATHFNLHLSTVSICVKKQKYKRFYVEKQGTGGS